MGPFNHFSLEDEQRKRERAFQKVGGKPGVLCHRSQGKRVPRITELFAVISAENTHIVSRESFSRC